MSVRIGVLGCADFARRKMLPALTVAPEFEVVAVASRSPEKAAAFAAEFGCEPVLGYERLLERSDVDAVYVPLPAALHAEWVEAALLAGKHVLAEKPLTIDSGRTRGLLTLAQDRGLALLENVMFVHHSQHRAVRRLLASGAIGELRSFHANFTIPRRPMGDIRYDAELGGGALYDVGIYPVRAALYFLGPGLTVVGAALSYAEVDLAGVALLRGGRGIVAHVTFGLDHAYDSSYELCGSTGRITVDRAFTPPADLAPLVRVDGESVPLPADDQVANTLAAFAAAVSAGAAPADDCLRQAELLAEIRCLADAYRL